MRSERFHTPSAPRLSIENTSGGIEVETVEGQETSVELVPLNDAGREAVAEATLEQHGDRILVEMPERRRLFARDARVAVRVRCPAGSSADVRTVSADSELRGVYDEVEFKSVSGDVRIADVRGDARVKTVSGDVRIGPVARSATVQSVSGDVTVERAGGPAELRSVSGDVRLGAAGEDVTVQTVSGDQSLDMVTTGAVQLKSVSGDVQVGVAPGTRVWIDARSMSGSTESEVDLSGDGPAGDEDGPLVEIRANALSGDIRLRRAR